SGGVIGAFALGGLLAMAAMFGRMRYLLFAVVMAIGVTTAIVTSQGRGVVVASVIILLAYGRLAYAGRGRTGTLLGVAIAGVVAFVVAQAIIGGVGGGSQALRYQGLSATKIVSTTGQARGKSISAIPRNLANYPLGAGLATAGPASGVAGA